MGAFIFAIIMSGHSPAHNSAKEKTALPGKDGLSDVWVGACVLADGGYPLHQVAEGALGDVDCHFFSDHPVQEGLAHR